MISQARWQPLLYGRTARADRWWRLRPYDVKIEWLNAVVVAGTGGGEGLASHPRFLLARRGPLLLVGVACLASALSDTMNSDGSRPFYTFVGWVTRDGQGLPPDWDIFLRGWKVWSTKVYQAWMPLDWDKHRTDLGDGHESPFCDAPWTIAAATASRSQADSPDRIAPPARGRTILVPADAAPRIWSALSTAAFDFAFAASFDRPPANVKGTLTHASVISIEAPAVQHPADQPPERVLARERQEPAMEPEMPLSSPEISARESTQDTQLSGWRSKAEGKARHDDGSYHAASWEQDAPSREQNEYGEASQAQNQASQGGLFNRMKRLLLPEDDEDDPSDESRPRAGSPSRRTEEGYQYGPMKDLDYWTQREKPRQPRPGERPKQPPPGDDS